MTGMPLSHTMAELLHRRDQLGPAIARGVQEVKRCNEAEAIALAAYEEAKARAFLRAEGPVREREAKATLATLKERQGLHIAVALRRSATEALHVLGKDLDCLAALGHAYNRELKAEQHHAGP